MKIKKYITILSKTMDRDTFKFNEHFIDKSEEILKWKHPFSCIVAGPSGSGKTSFVLKLIKNADVLFNKVPTMISWHYSEFQNWMMDDNYIGMNFVEGLPDENIAKLFTKGSHHKNASVIFLTQNIFHQNKHSRTINLNAHYLVMFRNVRDAS